MIKKILGVVVGYIAMIIIVSVGFFAGFIVFGANNAMNPGLFTPSPLWIAYSFIIGLIGALLGGFACKLVSGSSGAVSVFAGIVFALGAAMAFALMAMDMPAGARPEGMPDIEAFARGIQPVWVAWVNPFIGAIGILIGGSLKKK